MHHLTEKERVVAAVHLIDDPTFEDGQAVTQQRRPRLPDLMVERRQLVQVAAGAEP
ncbi:MAG: hypothetical protein U0531_18775 [Dehalococcoidia bacterium]